MEYSFFLLIGTVCLMLIYSIVFSLIKLANWHKGILFVLIGGGIVLSVFFHWIGISLTLMFIAELLTQYVPFFKKGRALKFGILFAMINGLFLIGYLPVSTGDEIWNQLSMALDRFGLMRGKLIDVFYVIRYFGYHIPIYPALIAGTMHLAFRHGLREKIYKNSFWYRFIRSFDHRQVFLMLIGFSGLAIAQLTKADQFIVNIAINFAVYFATPYIFFGFVTIIYGIRKLRISYFIALIALYSVVLISSSKFVFSLMILLGIGVSDIWMNYHHRKIKLFQKRSEE